MWSHPWSCITPPLPQVGSSSVFLKNENHNQDHGPRIEQHETLGSLPEKFVRIPPMSEKESEFRVCDHEGERCGRHQEVMGITRADPRQAPGPSDCSAGTLHLPETLAFFLTGPGPSFFFLSQKILMGFLGVTFHVCYFQTAFLPTCDKKPSKCV